jgi:peptide deformylase
MEKIVTIYDDNSHCLKQQSIKIELTKTGLEEAKIIANKLFDTIKSLMPAAGLAGAQIGIAKQIFIYSWDRKIENMQIAINPTILKFNGEKIAKWEACFSAMKDGGMVKAAKVDRSNNIEVEYYDLDGKKINLRLTGFAAILFQHEYDHLQGIVNTNKEDTTIKEFSSKEEFIEFIESLNESAEYIEPIQI